MAARISYAGEPADLRCVSGGGGLDGSYYVDAHSQSQHLQDLSFFSAFSVGGRESSRGSRLPDAAADEQPPQRSSLSKADRGVEADPAADDLYANQNLSASASNVFKGQLRWPPDFMSHEDVALAPEQQQQHGESSVPAPSSPPPGERSTCSRDFSAWQAQMRAYWASEAGEQQKALLRAECLEEAKESLLIRDLDHAMCLAICAADFDLTDRDFLLSPYFPKKYFQPLFAEQPQPQERGTSGALGVGGQEPELLHPACVYAICLTHRAPTCGRKVCKLDGVKCVKMGMTKHLDDRVGCAYCRGGRGVVLGKRARLAFYREMDRTNVTSVRDFFYLKEVESELVANVYERWLKKRAWEAYGFPAQHLEYFPVGSSSSGASSSSGPPSRGPSSVSEFREFLEREVAALEREARRLRNLRRRGPAAFEALLEEFSKQGEFLLETGGTIFQQLLAEGALSTTTPARCWADLDLANRVEDDRRLVTAPAGDMEIVCEEAPAAAPFPEGVRTRAGDRRIVEDLDQSQILVPDLQRVKKYRRKPLLADDDSPVLSAKARRLQLR